MKLTCVSLYTGCGGLDLGFHDAGFETVWANEISPDAVATYRNELRRRGHHNCTLVCGDIKDTALPKAGSADVVIGGPPCQGFSIAGKMDPDDPRSRHVWEFFRVVEHVRPRAFVMENVKALAKNERWKQTRRSLIEKAESLGFKTRLLLLNAADYGVPQLRERMFLIGVRDALVRDPPKNEHRMSVREALRQLPPHGEVGNDSLCKAIVTLAKNPVLRKSPFAGMLFNGQGRPLDLESPALTLPASMGGNRTPIIDQESLLRNTEPWVRGYHRALMEDKTPPDSKAPARLRRLTVEEAAMIQGFPKGMMFIGSQCSKFRQIGNSVPPRLGEVVARSVELALSSKKAETEYTFEGNQLQWLAEGNGTAQLIS